MTDSFEFDDVDAFTVGTVGPRGQRVFFIQVQDGGQSFSFRLEKQQVAALAEYLFGVIDDLPPTEGERIDLTDQFIDPFESEWTIGAIGAAYEAGADRLVILCEELEDDDSSDGASMRVRLDRHQALGFIEHARELVSAGRPPCSFCGRPLEGDGSFCPCSN